MERMMRGNGVNVSPIERWASVLGGTSLLMRGLRRGRNWKSVLIGADLIRRGASGHCYLYHFLGITTAPRDSQRVSVPYRQGIRVDEAITVSKSPEELYRYWRQLENLPHFMENLISVSQTDERRSRWVASGPAGRQVEWEAEIINDVPGQVIGWRSLPGSDVDNAGSVQFRKLSGDRGTVVNVELQYVPPGGIAAALAAKLFGQEPEQQVRRDLRRLKQLMEAGEVPLTHPSAESVAAPQRRRQPGRMEPGFQTQAAAS
jgi:uncharacterized membrane protein